MLTRTGIGNVLDCLDCGSDDENFCESSDEPFPDEPFLDATLPYDELDFILGTVVLLHLDFPSITAGGGG